MQLSGVIGTTAGVATCGLMIYKKPEWAGLTVLTSFAAGFATYYSFHQLMVLCLPQNIVEFLDGASFQSFYLENVVLNTDFRYHAPPRAICDNALPNEIFTYVHAENQSRFVTK